MPFKKGQTTFEMGIHKPGQLMHWLEKNQASVLLLMAGRSNVGKSSIINSLFGKKTAKTSKTPGRTQQINIFSFYLDEESDTPYYLLDLPGYGHASVSHEMKRNWDELLGNLFSLLPTTSVILNIQDARHPQQKADLDFYEYISLLDSTIVVAFNKIDKLKKQKEKAALKKVKKELQSMLDQAKEFHYVSAESKEGLDNLESSLETLLKEIKLSVL